MIPSQPTIWHNPRCRKSREALALLQDQGIQPIVRLYLKDAPSKDEITALRDVLGITANAMIRKGGQVYKDLELSDANEAELIAAMAENPILIERPVFIHDGKAAIGRPPETVLEIV